MPFVIANGNFAIVISPLSKKFFDTFWKNCVIRLRFRISYHYGHYADVIRCRLLISVSHRQLLPLYLYNKPKSAHVKHKFANHLNYFSFLGSLV